jgi:hypothetical protein
MNQAKVFTLAFSLIMSQPVVGDSSRFMDACDAEAGGFFTTLIPKLWSNRPATDEKCHQQQTYKYFSALDLKYVEEKQPDHNYRLKVPSQDEGKTGPNTINQKYNQIGKARIDSQSQISQKNKRPKLTINLENKSSIKTVGGYSTIAPN